MSSSSWSTALLLVAALLLVLIACAHSYLGERYILIRLVRRDLPKLFGSDWFTKNTLRWTWHALSLAWLGFAAVLVVLARYGGAGSGLVLRAVALSFLVTAAIAAAASRAKHLSWIVFLAVALLVWTAA